jgi:hypothetical protein
MREILEDAAVLYREELESLQLVVAPALVLGPALVIVASMGLFYALATVPLFLLLYLLTYAAGVHAADDVLHNNEPRPLPTYLIVLERAPELVRLGAPAAVLLAGLVGAALVVSDAGFPLVALLFGLVAAVMVGAWLSKHAYDTPLVMAQGLSAEDVSRIDDTFSREEQTRALALAGAVALPLALVGLVCWGLGAALVPLAGAGIFVIGLALWLPFAALAITQACARLVEETAVPGEQPAAGSPHYAGSP